MKHATTALIALCMVLMTISSASAALTDASWQDNGAKTLTIQAGGSATFDWYAVSAWTGFTVNVKLYEGATNLGTLYTATPYDGYAGGPLTITPSHYYDPGTYTITVTGKDCVSTDTTDLTLIVEAAPKPPAASFTWTPTSPTTGQQVQFTDQSSDSDGSVVSYYWSFGDGSSSSSKNPAHTYTSPGAYTVRLTVTDDDGLTDTEQKTIMVTKPDTPITGINVGASPTSGYAPLSVSFTCTAIGGDAPISYAWSFGDGAQSWTQHPTHVYQSPGTYTATCTATDDDGDTKSGTIAITAQQQPLENRPPEMAPIPDQDVNEGSPFSYDLQVSDPDGDDLTCYDAQFMVTNSELKYVPDWLSLDKDDCRLYGTAPEVNNDLEFYVRVGVRDPAGLYDEEDFLLTVVDNPITPTASFTWSPVSPFEDEQVQFTDQSSDSDGSVVSYYWSFG
ncbi:PKD domain-containing protein, partial [Candidatus Woesearchaeota archaeon]|nr:PKD domain-containing protein [Candidatus Woesearchaeota archaeon]